MMHETPMAGGPLIQAILLGLIMVWPVWRIFRRAGFQPALSLLVFLPGLGWLILYLILAFATWPHADIPNSEGDG